MWILVECRPFFLAVFMRKTNEHAWENREDLECYDLGENNGQVRVCGYLECANIEMGPLGPSIWCGYWWNADHSSLPFSWRKIQMASEKPWKVELDEEGGNDSHILVCGYLECANIEMGPLGLPIWCGYWWNADHSSLPFSWWKIQMASEKPRKVGLDEEGGIDSLILVYD
jgi:hypothetical protein